MKLSKRLFLLIVLLSAPVFSAEHKELHTVREVINGKSFILDSGDTVRLASLQVPNAQEQNGKKRLGEPLGEQARGQLAALIGQHKVYLKTSASPRDRKNRIVAQAYLDDDTWLQQSMLESGYAMVYPIFEDSKKSDLEKMLTAEDKARAEKKGIWAHPYYAVLTPDEAKDNTDKFRIVRGVPLDIEAKRGNVYINFGKDWNSDFTVYLPKRYARSFEHSGIENMAGKTIEVRGWIDDKGGPWIELVRPEQIRTVD